MGILGPLAPALKERGSRNRISRAGISSTALGQMGTLKTAAELSLHKLFQGEWFDEKGGLISLEQSIDLCPPHMNVDEHTLVHRVSVLLQDQQVDLIISDQQAITSVLTAASVSRSGHCFLSVHACIISSVPMAYIDLPSLHPRLIRAIPSTPARMERSRQEDALRSNG